MSLALEVLVLNADNGNWELDEVFHYCLGQTLCPLHCKNAQHSKKMVLDAIEMSLCSALTVALLYRWKGFEQASAWTWRGRREHDLLGRALKHMFSAATVAKAEADAQLMLAAGIEVASATKNQIRGGKVLKFFEVDVKARKLETALVMNGPLQHFLNAAFNAEALVEAVSDIAIVTTASAETPPADFGNAAMAAMKENWKIISGERGNGVCREMAQMLESYSSPLWEGLRLTRVDIFKASSAYLVGMSDAWDRLVFAYAQTKYQLFKVWHIDDANANLDVIRTCLAELIDSAKSCRNRADAHFTRIWLHRLWSDNPRIYKRAIRSIRMVLSILRVNSSKCERKHLLGQETRRMNGRGKALQCMTLSKVTYLKGVVRSAAKTREAVFRSVFGDKEIRKRFFLSVASYKIGRRQRARTDSTLHRVRACVRRSSRAKVRAYDIFRRRHPVAAPVSDGNPQRLLTYKQDADGAWSNLPRHEVAALQADADGENGRNVGDINFQQLCDLRRGQPRSHHHSSQTRVVVEKTLRDMQSHPFLSAAAQAGSFDSPLAPGKVVVAETEAAVDAAERSTFRYNQSPMKNRKGVLKPFLPCVMKNGGLCCNDVLCGVSNTLVHNFYLHMVNGKAKDKLPLLFLFSVLGVGEMSELHFVTKFKGIGTGVLMVQAKSGWRINLDGLGTPIASLETLADGTPTIAHGQLVFQRLLYKSAACIGVEPSTFTSVRLECLPYKDYEGADRFECEYCYGEMDATLSGNLSTKASVGKLKPTAKIPFCLTLKPRIARRVARKRQVSLYQMKSMILMPWSTRMLF